jgi:hypothetical protein
MDRRARKAVPFTEGIRAAALGQVAAVEAEMA